MERQALIFILLLILLLASKGMNFAEEPTIARVPIRDRLASAARSFLGLPYRWGGMSERRGVDCSGLVKILFAKLHIELPRNSSEQVRFGENIPIQKLQTGDLVFFSSNGATPDHVGLYVGENQFVHAEKKAGHVIISDLNQPWYLKHFLTARRVVKS